MSRPTVAHDGFFVPNAQDVTRPGMAEPDRIDFNTIGNSRWGVIEGCLVTISLSTATVTSGTALVNGALVGVTGGQSVGVGTGGTQDRYDLLGIDTNGSLKVVRGTPGADPVFPDAPVDFTTLAAVFATAGGSDYGDNVVDKRNFLLDSLLTKIPPTQDLILNRNGTGNHFRVTGEGNVSWNDDTWMQRIDVASLQIHNNLDVLGTLHAGGAVTGDSFTAQHKLSGTNLKSSTAAPLNGTDPGDIYQNAVTGRLYVWQSGTWQELATLNSAMPVGTVINSLSPPEQMVPLGWVPLNGAVIDENTYPALFSVLALTQFIQTGTPRTMRMPDARRRMLLTDFTLAGQPGGATSFTLTKDNLPLHKHNVRLQASGGLSLTARTGRGGQHGHSVTGGDHSHAVSDPGHKHPALEGFGSNAQAIGVFWGGNNKIDALFNDRSHTYSVEPYSWSGVAYSGITVSSAGSVHAHAVSENGDHDHPISIDPVAGHTHVVAEDNVGLGTSIPFTPSYLAVYTYVRS